MFAIAESTTIKSLHGFYIKGIDANLPQLQSLLLKYRHVSVIPVSTLKIHAKAILTLLPTNIKYMHAMDMAARCVGYRSWSAAISAATEDHRRILVITNLNNDSMASNIEYLQSRDITQLFTVQLSDIPFDFTLLKKPDILLDGYGWDHTLIEFEASLATYTLPINYLLLRPQANAYLTWLCRDLIEYGVYAHRVQKHPFIVNDKLIKLNSQ